MDVEVRLRQIGNLLFIRDRLVNIHKEDPKLPHIAILEETVRDAVEAGYKAQFLPRKTRDRLINWLESE
jgi:hypothetical protein